jgi:hypothetical protein
MRTTLRNIALATLAVTLLLSGCSKKPSGPVKVIPADADLVVSLDAKALLAYAKATLAKAVPAEFKDQIPSVEMIVGKVAQLAGVDLEKVTRVTFIGYLSSPEKMVLIAEGLTAQGMKGEKAGDRNGVARFTIAAANVHYAELPGVGLVAGPNPAVLDGVIDTFSGKAKNITESERGKLLDRLLDSDKDLDQVRAYVLTGKFPGADASMPVQGGGMFLHLDKGVSMFVLADEATAGKIKQAIDFGMMGLSASLALGGLPETELKFDEATKKLLTETLRKISTAQNGGMVSMSYKGDLKPLIEKALGLWLTLEKPEPPPPPVEVKPAPGDGERPAPVDVAKDEGSKPATGAPPAP